MQLVILCLKNIPSLLETPNIYFGMLAEYNLSICNYNDIANLRLYCGGYHKVKL